MNQQTAVATPRTLKTMLAEDGYKRRLHDVLGARAPQFAAALVQVVANSWHLQKCTPESVIGAAITAAALDLSLDPNLGEAHLVPYGQNCQFQLGYKGLTQLGLRSGQFKRLGWAVVYPGQLKKWNELTGELDIDFSVVPADGAEPCGYAAYFMLVNGFERGSYWTAEEVDQHALRFSQAYKKDKKDSPWFTDFDTMALKTVLKELLNHWAPKSVQMQTAIIRDHQVFIGTDEAGYTDNVRDPVRPIFGGDPEGEGTDLGPQKASTAPINEPTPQETVEEAKAKKYIPSIRLLLARDKISEVDLLNYLRGARQIEESLNTLEEVALMQPGKIADIDKGWKEIRDHILKAKEAKAA